MNKICLQFLTSLCLLGLVLSHQHYVGIKQPGMPHTVKAVHELLTHIQWTTPTQERWELLCAHTNHPHCPTNMMHVRQCMLAAEAQRGVMFMGKATQSWFPATCKTSKGPFYPAGYQIATRIKIFTYKTDRCSKLTFGAFIVVCCFCFFF